MPIIFAYTRHDAIEDGVLVDATVGFGPRCANDYKGVWHDICWMLRIAISRQLAERSSPELLFRVVITGAGPSKNWTFKAVMGPDDEGEACLTIMLPDED